MTKINIMLKYYNAYLDFICYIDIVYVTNINLNKNIIK